MWELGRKKKSRLNRRIWTSRVLSSTASRRSNRSCVEVRKGQKTMDRIALALPAKAWKNKYQSLLIGHLLCARFSGGCFLHVSLHLIFMITGDFSSVPQAMD